MARESRSQRTCTLARVGKDTRHQLIFLGEFRCNQVIANVGRATAGSLSFNFGVL
jgi:hypothetical protein